VRKSQKTTISKTEKTIPAIAAAFGVFRFSRVSGPVCICFCDAEAMIAPAQ
jgi:hypothetical protein